MRKILLWCVVALCLVSLSGVIRAEEQKDFWTKFGLGSWVLMEAPGGTKIRQTLVSKSKDEYVLKYETIVNDKVVYSNNMTISLKQGAKGGTAIPTPGHVDAQVKQSKETVTIKGKSVSCTVYDTKTAQTTSKNWMSEQVPGGVVKSIVNGAVVNNVLDFGVK